MTSPQNLRQLSERFNVNEHFLEVISDQEKLDTVIQNIRSERDINIEIIRFIFNSEYYPSLEIKLNEKRKKLIHINDFKTRVKINEEIKILSEEIKIYKIDVLLNASLLIKVRSTDKIEKVKDYFFRGEISTALKELNNEQIANESKQLQTLLRTSIKLEEVYERLVDNAFEFLMKGRLTILNLEINSSKDRYYKSIEFIEKGLISVKRSRKLKPQADYKFQYGLFLQNQNKFQKAIKLYQDSLDLAKKLAGAEQKIISSNSVSIANTLNNLAMVQKDSNKIEDAEESYLNALTIKESLSKVDPEIFEPSLMRTINNFASFYITIAEYGKALNLLNKRLRLCKNLSDKRPEKYLKYYAMTLHNLGLVHKKENKLTAAEKYYYQALEIRRQLAENGSEESLLDLAMTIGNLANTYEELNNSKSAEKLHTESLQLFNTLAEKNPGKFGPDLAIACRSLAGSMIDRKDYISSEKFYLKAVKVLEPLAHEDPDAFLSELGQTYYNLAELLCQTKSWEKSMQYSRKSHEAFLKLLQINKKLFSPFIAKSLLQRGNLNAYQNKEEVAIDFYKEASKIQNSIIKDRRNIEDLRPLAEILNSLAQAYLKISDFKNAQNSNKKAIKLFKKLSRKDFRVFAPDLAYSFSIKAMIHQSKYFSMLQNRFQIKMIDHFNQMLGSKPRRKKNFPFSFSRVQLFIQLALTEHNYKKAISIQRILFLQDSSRNLIEYSSSLYNFIFFLTDTDAVRRAVFYALEFMDVTNKYISRVPVLEQHYSKVSNLLKVWGIEYDSEQKDVSSN